MSFLFWLFCCIPFLVMLGPFLPGLAIAPVSYQPLDIVHTKVEFSRSTSASLQTSLPNSFIATFGDYNSDTRIDWMFIRTDRDTGKKFVDVYDIGSSSEMEAAADKPTVGVDFTGQGTHTLSTLKLLASVAVDVNADGVIATDWNFDGYLDLLAICSTRNYRPVIPGTDGLVATRLGGGPGSTRSPPGSLRYSVVGYLQDPKTGQLREAWRSSSASALDSTETSGGVYSDIYPFIVDVNNDGRPDLVGQVSAASDDPTASLGKSGRFVWVNQKNKFEAAWWSDMAEYIDGANQSVGVIPDPHSSAFVDMNGDCKSDIVLVVEDGEQKGQLAIEVWLNSMIDGKAKYKKGGTLPLPSGSGQVVFGDFNADGTVDIVVPACERSASCQACCTGKDRIYMSANGQIPMCSSQWGRKGTGECRTIPGLCQSSPFTISNFSGKQNPDFSVSYLGDDGDDASYHLAGDAQHPITFRAGDFDGDGFPDLLLLVRKHTEVPTIRLYKNVEDPKSSNASYPLRSFRLSHEFNMDVFERGVLDVIGFGVVNEVDGVGISQSFVQSAESDVLFLKATGLNGVCTKSCANGSDRVPYGVNAHGPTFKVTVTDLSGNKNPRTATQLCQSAHQPLALPYVLFGLGRTNNYIEEFFLGMPVAQSEYTNMWISIIPNSQVIAIPYRLEHPKEWTLELSVSPSRKFVSILLATVITLLVVGGLIFFLDRREKVEDLVEHRGFRSHFIIN